MRHSSRLRTPSQTLYYRPYVATYTPCKPRSLPGQVQSLSGTQPRTRRWSGSPLGLGLGAVFAAARRSVSRRLGAGVRLDSDWRSASMASILFPGPKTVHLLFRLQLVGFACREFGQERWVDRTSSQEERMCIFEDGITWSCSSKRGGSYLSGMFSTCSFAVPSHPGAAVAAFRTPDAPRVAVGHKAPGQLLIACYVCRWRSAACCQLSPAACCRLRPVCCRLRPAVACGQLSPAACCRLRPAVA
jgi:hypothetical protein